MFGLKFHVTWIRFSLVQKTTLPNIFWTKIEKFYHKVSEDKIGLTFRQYQVYEQTSKLKKLIISIAIIFRYDSRKIKEACEIPGSLSQDPFGSTPVTSIPSGFTYKNYFCSVCNRDSENVRFWRPRLECPTLTSYNNRFKNLTKSFIENNLFLR